MRVLVTGATGTIGAAVAELLLDRGDDVVGLSRDPERAREREPRLRWHGWAPEAEPPPAAALEGIDAVINLVGEPIDQRWSTAAKRRIRDSRVTATRNLIAAMLASPHPPRALISGSAVGYYGDRGDALVDEDEGPGTSFDARLCLDWEATAQEAEAGGIRVVTIRTGLVLAQGAGLLKAMLPAFRLGLGGPIADGHHYMPWISLADEAGIIVWALDNEDATGAYNATAPNPVTNREFTKALGRALGRPTLLPVPKLAIKARLGRELGEIAASSGQRAIPARATEGGYEFRFTDIDAALADAVG